MKTKELYTTIENVKMRSAWDRGVKEYALEMLEYIQDDYPEITRENAKEILLNGASDWHQYSYGGCSLIFDNEIAERLCCPSELKRKKGGELPPNNCEEWLDVQARALRRAFLLIRSFIR